MKDKEQLSFWKQVQIQIEFELKILEAKLLLNLNWIY
jgi:hypothetical protein